MSPRPDFSQRHAKWALISGAAEGIGAGFAQNRGAILTNNLKHFSSVSGLKGGVALINS
jgi:hypothetical protein